MDILRETEPNVDKALNGHELIAHYVKSLEGMPGVYRMLDASSRVLYIGKARNLRKRVSSYAKSAGHSDRIMRMIRQTAKMEFLSTRTETEALLLEQNLIKQLKPRYNVLFRDDKSFPNILVSGNHAFPQIKKHRGAKRVAGKYYGPFANADAVNRTLTQLQRVFLLRTCSDSVFGARTRPCLLYQIKRCSAPCVGKISTHDYGALVADAQRFLDGKSSEIQSALAKEMGAASAAFEFEHAGVLRDRIKALTQVQQSQSINPRGLRNGDVIGLDMQAEAACVQVVFIRANQSWGSHPYFPKTGAGAGAPEILQAFVTQFYDGKEPPPTILLSHRLEDEDLISEALSAKAGRRVELRVPQRGERAQLMTNALRNARENLARRLAESTSQLKLLKGLATAFELKAPPERIEVYDNSHLQGAHAVGAMIVAGPEGFGKNQYRKFNIKDSELTLGDDFAMMREVLNRRFKRLIEENPEREAGGWPDLVLIDGGAGHVSAARAVFSELGVTGIDLFGVAKGVERNAGKEIFHAANFHAAKPKKTPFTLPYKDPTLYFVQRLRDEAHRFAISTHRAKRKKDTFKNPLDEIPGVGAIRKKALLTHFGSAKAVSRAGLKDLQAVEGISRTTAEIIYDFFHDA